MIYQFSKVCAGVKGDVKQSKVASQQWRLWKFHVKHYFEKNKVSVCVRGRSGGGGMGGQGGGGSMKSVRQTWQTEGLTWQWTHTLHSLVFVLFSLQLGQTVSNNSEHLRSLQALHPSPWGSSPGTGGPTQLPLPLESCLEQADYHTSPRRDMRPGILSNSFTLIIRTEWQCCKNADTYHQCSTKPSHTIKKSTFPKGTMNIW